MAVAFTKHPEFGKVLLMNSLIVDATCCSSISYRLDDTVNLSVVNIPDELKDENGNSKIDFTFADSTIENGDGQTDLNMEVLQSFDTSESVSITVRSEDTSGNSENPIQEETFQLNTDAFSPRTIEEF